MVLDVFRGERSAQGFAFGEGGYLIMSLVLSCQSKNLLVAACRGELGTVTTVNKFSIDGLSHVFSVSL